MPEQSQKLSASVRALVDQVNALAVQVRPGWIGRSRTNAMSPLLAAIASSGEWLAIPHLLSLAIAPHGDAAALAIRELSARISIRAMGRFDSLLRGSVGLLTDWYRLELADMARVAGGPGGATLVWLMMAHPSGYVREAAIRMTSVSSEHGQEMPFLLLRLNDWVPEVRRAASHALRARLVARCSDDLVAALPVLDAAVLWGRMEERSILDEIEAFLRSEAAAAALRRGLGDPRPLVRRSAFRRAVESVGLERPAVLRIALADRDLAVRLWAGRWLERSTDPSVGLAELTAQLLHDSNASIRRRGLRRALEQELPVSLDRFLADPDPESRILAQAALLSRDVDVVARYRALVGSARARTRAAALGGLAEAAGSDAEPELRRFLADRAPTVRRAALRALADIGAGDAVALGLAALADPAPSVTCGARDLLVRRAGVYSAAAAWAALESAASGHGQANALAVVGRSDAWERLPYLLRATRRDPALRQRAIREITRWLAQRSRRFTSPSPVSASAIAEELAIADLAPAARAEIAESLAGQIRHH